MGLVITPENAGLWGAVAMLGITVILVHWWWTSKRRK